MPGWWSSSGSSLLPFTRPRGIWQLVSLLVRPRGRGRGASEQVRGMNDGINVGLFFKSVAITWRFAVTSSQLRAWEDSSVVILVVIISSLAETFSDFTETLLKSSTAALWGLKRENEAAETNLLSSSWSSIQTHLADSLLATCGALPGAVSHLRG